MPGIAADQLVFCLARVLEMPARTKKAEAAAEVWRKRKGADVTSNRPKKFKTWSNESMLKGIDAVRDGTMSAYKAARSYNVLHLPQRSNFRSSQAWYKARSHSLLG